MALPLGEHLDGNWGTHCLYITRAMLGVTTPCLSQDWQLRRVCWLQICESAMSLHHAIWPELIQVLMQIKIAAGSASHWISSVLFHWSDWYFSSQPTFVSLFCLMYTIILRCTGTVGFAFRWQSLWPPWPCYHIPVFAYMELSFFLEHRLAYRTQYRAKF